MSDDLTIVLGAEDYNALEEGCLEQYRVSLEAMGRNDPRTLFYLLVGALSQWIEQADNGTAEHSKKRVATVKQDHDAAKLMGKKILNVDLDTQTFTLVVYARPGVTNRQALLRLGRRHKATERLRVTFTPSSFA